MKSEIAHEKQSEPQREYVQFRIPQITRSFFSTTHVLVVLLVLAAFYSGYSTSQIRLLKGKSLTPTVQAAPQVQPAGAAAPLALAPGQKVKVDIGHFPIKGNDSAKVTIVAFEDFRCPFCERFYTQVEGQLIKEYVDTGKVKLAFRQYQFLGAPSVIAGNAAECANEQNKFWEFHDYLYKNQPSESDVSMYTSDKLSAIAGGLGMDVTSFKSCLDSTKYQKNVDQDLADGQKAGVTATPTFYINGTQLVGAQPYSAFKTIIDQELTN
jgi:protein-disulfide isomerase